MAAQEINFTVLPKLTPFYSTSYKVKQKSSIAESVKHEIFSDVNSNITSGYSRYKSVFLELTSADGDTISLSMKPAVHQKSIIKIDDTDGKMKDQIVVNVNNYLVKMRDEMSGRFNEKNSINVNEKSVSESIPIIFDYWNAENTSQRIVEFSFSFHSNFSGSDQEFFEKIKTAIDEGFKRAKDLIGRLPDAVTTLIDDTYKMVMDKLDYRFSNLA